MWGGDGNTALLAGSRKAVSGSFGKNSGTDAKLPEACLGAKKHDSSSANVLKSLFIGQLCYSRHAITIKKLSLDASIES